MYMLDEHGGSHPHFMAPYAHNGGGCSHRSNADVISLSELLLLLSYEPRER